MTRFFIEEIRGLLHQIFGFMLLLIVLFVAAFMLPWELINWGKIELASNSMVTVTGYAEEKLRSQVARFNVGVDATNEGKEVAINTVNEAMDEIIQVVIDFGIDRNDVNTQSVSVNRIEEPLFDKGNGEVVWRASNSIEIVLRDVDKASELTDLLSTTQATSVYGPNFSFDDTSGAKSELISLAIEDAKEKALLIAEASGRKLGKVISVSENGVSGPVFPMMMRAESLSSVTPVEPGTGTVSQSMIVSFELE